MDKRLIDAMTVYLANNLALYWSSAVAHWNVEGHDFFELHLLFEKIYGDIYDQIDVIAEKIRAIHGYVISDPIELLKLATVGMKTRPATSIEMVESLEHDNEEIQKIIMIAFKAAEDANEQGIANFLAERLDLHQKWTWMLRATRK